MSVKSTIFPQWDDIFGDVYKLDMPTMSGFLPDDIWKKFDLDTITVGNLFDDLLVKWEYPCVNSSPALCEIRNHDCMWAGHCGSKEHPADEPRTNVWPFKYPIEKRPVTKPPVHASRSLLVKQPPIKPPQTSLIVASPESPPMSDDEETKGKTTSLQLHQGAISDLDDDSDLCEYFEEDEPLSEPVEDPPRRAQYAQQNDHSYHKDKNAAMRITNLGIETPSDSEEEIDVVSVVSSGDKQNRMVCTLPNNPSSLDRRQLQKTMATAISNKRLNSTGIKTILPFRKPSIDQSPVKRRMSNSRGIKRPRYQHNRLSTPTSSPYRRRGGYNHSSDSEAEPSEKRSLHNNMERQRRIDLRNAFEDLRLLIPEINKKDRAAKVVILREAAIYCDQLGDMSESMENQVDDLRKQQERLRARVSQLRRNLAAKHR